MALFSKIKISSYFSGIYRPDVSLMRCLFSSSFSLLNCTLKIYCSRSGERKKKRKGGNYVGKVLFPFPLTLIFNGAKSFLTFLLPLSAFIFYCYDKDAMKFTVKWPSIRLSWILQIKQWKLQKYCQWCMAIYVKPPIIYIHISCKFPIPNIALKL